MSNNSIRIRTNPGESKNIQVKIEQDFDALEILSLKITQEDLYRSFCADYGVVVGRVISNNGFGVPNAKISVFIPVTSEDEKNELIKNLYPYKTTNTKNSDGIRYNLLLRESTCRINKAVGTFPTKEDVLNDELVLEVFEKYYKFTTRTNNAGDYIIFGAPTGQQTIHMDVDLSDIGLVSVRPYELIADGSPEDLFENGAEYKVSPNLDSLSQIKSSDKAVDVIPFWGDPEQCQIGITRVDFDTGVDLKPHALFTGSLITDSAKNYMSRSCNIPKEQGNHEDLATSSGTIEVLKLNEDLNGNPTGIELTDLGGNIIDGDGVFTFPLPMYLKKVVTDEFGNLVLSDDPKKGVPTTGKYRFKMNLNGSEGKPKKTTASIFFPSLSRDFGGSVGTEQQRWTTDINQYDNSNAVNRTPTGPLGRQMSPNTPKTIREDLDLDFHEMRWKQIYTISHMIKKVKMGGNRFSFLGIKGTDEGVDFTPFPYTTAVNKFDIIFLILSFIIGFIVKIIRILIILANITFCMSFRLGFRICIAKACKSFCLIPCVRILPAIAPFSFITSIIPRFDLPCDDDNYTIETDCNDSYCACEKSGDCAPAGCCANSNNNCSSDRACLSFAIIVPSEDPNSNTFCAALDALEQWFCCVIYSLARRRKVIRLSFFNAWVTGTAYLFQFERRIKNTSSGAHYEFCGPGSYNDRGDTFAEGSGMGTPGTAGDDTDFNGEVYKRCNWYGCLVISPDNSATIQNPTDGSNSGGGGGTYYGVPNGSPGPINGASDTGQFTYCNQVNPTKIVNLGSLEVCEDILYKIDRCIQNNNCVLSEFSLNGRINPFTNGLNAQDLKIGTGGEAHFDRIERGPEFNITSYGDPRLVILYLLRTTNCNVGKLFIQSLGFGNDCNEFELKNPNYQLVKEVSKIHNTINSQPFLPSNPEIEVLNTTTPFLLNPKDLYRFSPTLQTNPNIYTPNNATAGILQDYFQFMYKPSVSYTRIGDNLRRNKPYFFFGLHPGKTAIEKLRQEYFSQ
jgi:hypothetical protein